jgi:hypothetical protein
MSQALCKGLGVVLFTAGITVSTALFVAAATNQHVSEALREAEEAVKHGQQGHVDRLDMHAEEALGHVQMADKEMTGNPHLQESMRGLEDAIMHAKQGHTDKGTQAAEGAVRHLSEVP